MKRQGIPDIKTAEEYFELAKQYARARENATDSWAKSRLFTMEQSYLVLAKSARALARSEKVVPPEHTETER